LAPREDCTTGCERRDSWKRGEIAVFWPICGVKSGTATRIWFHFARSRALSSINSREKSLTGGGALVHNFSTLRLFPFHHPCELGITMAKKKKGAKAASKKSSKAKRSAKKKGAKKGSAKKSAKRSAKKSGRKPAKKATRAAAPSTPAPMSAATPYSAPVSSGMGGTTEGGLGW
jgi:hypothetical protein